MHQGLRAAGKYWDRLSSLPESWLTLHPQTPNLIVCSERTLVLTVAVPHAPTLGQNLGVLWRSEQRSLTGGED